MDIKKAWKVYSSGTWILGVPRYHGVIDAAELLDFYFAGLEDEEDEWEYGWEDYSSWMARSFPCVLNYCYLDNPSDGWEWDEDEWEWDEDEWEYGWVEYGGPKITWSAWNGWQLLYEDKMSGWEWDDGGWEWY